MIPESPVFTALADPGMTSWRRKVHGLETRPAARRANRKTQVDISVFMSPWNLGILNLALNFSDSYHYYSI